MDELPPFFHLHGRVHPDGRGSPAGTWHGGVPRSSPGGAKMVTMAGTSPSDDMHVRDFVRVLRRLTPHLPISDAYERDRPQLRGAWWSSQKEHMARWFSDQDGRSSGAITRKEFNTSARTTCNRLLCPAAFVWMAEALGKTPPW
jgi:hypothetical protein